MKINLPFNYQLRLYFSRMAKRTGVCSQIYQQKDKHILLWDFDDTPLEQIEAVLLVSQMRYTLPAIHIISSSPNSYHAYCFTSRSFREIIHILSATDKIDLKYLRLGMVRGYYTLRITPRKNDNFVLIKTLPSVTENETNNMSITINEYLTVNKGRSK